jgi:RNA polymerase sigma-70 factor (ECF subfamily)
MEELERVAASSGDPAEAALRGADAAAIQGALATLPPEQREAVHLAFFQGLTYVEVSARTGAPLGTVKSRMRLALERMRGLLIAGNAEHELRGH